MGVVSRRVVPVCGNLCFFCPSMRARSRQPVKRYKKLLADIFPRSQDAEPNERKIGKLCEYASKNPLRIPKITEYLEQRCYKDLRNGQFGSAKVVLCVYRKLLSSCKEQMPLFASSLLVVVRTLLQQARHEEMQILGCNILVDFIKAQMDSTYMFNLEGLIPKLCQLAQEVGDDDRALQLRSAGLQALAFMVWFMGEHSHISMDFDNIISVTLENYLDLQMISEMAKQDGQNSQPQDQLVQDGHKAEDLGSSIQDLGNKVSSLPNLVDAELGLDPKMDASKCPSYWSRVCLQNMARLAKEATTIRRVLEPLFHNFDAENQWASEKGLACSVLTYFHFLLEESGQNSHLLLSNLVKHLDNKNVAKEPLTQIEILNVTSHLAEIAKEQSSVAITGAISDLVKHLRKCIQLSSEVSGPRGCPDKCYIDLQSSLEKCISQLSIKVGDVGPILDMLAVVLENITTSTVLARTTVSAVYRTAQLISPVPNISYYKKAFPEALFHQLLLAMAHPDIETRVGAHHVFSIVLIPILDYHGLDPKRKTSLSLSSFIEGETKNKPKPRNGELLEEAKSSLVSYEGVKLSDTFRHTAGDGKPEVTSLRLSSHQVSLLLSSIWVQAAFTENTPVNFEAMARTYTIALAFIRSKTSSHVALVRCFQLAFSLRSMSLDQEGGLQPSRRRSLFTLASYMLIFSAKAGDLSGLIPIVKSSLTDVTMDPYLEMVDDIGLQAVSTGSDCGKSPYGSPQDDALALKSLSAIEVDDQQLKETVIAHTISKFGRLSEEDISSIRKQLLQGFSPDDAYPLGAPLFMDTPHPCSPLAQMELQAFDEVMDPAALTDDEAFPEVCGGQSGRKTSLSIGSLDVLSVNQLLESVLETARQVASFPVSSTPIPYDEMKNQCEALVNGKQRKMSVLQSFKHQQEAKAIIVSGESDTNSITLTNTYFQKVELPEGNLKFINKEEFRGRDQLFPCSHVYGQQSFRLPPSSPYDKFLKAAGC